MKTMNTNTAVERILDTDLLENAKAELLLCVENIREYWENGCDNGNLVAAALTFGRANVWLDLLHEVQTQYGVDYISNDEELNDMLDEAGSVGLEW